MPTLVTNAVTITDDELNLLIEALLAVSPTGGSSPQYKLACKLMPSTHDPEVHNIVQLQRTAQRELEADEPLAMLPEMLSRIEATRDDKHHVVALDFTLNGDSEEHVTEMHDYIHRFVEHTNDFTTMECKEINKP